MRSHGSSLLAAAALAMAAASNPMPFDHSIRMGADEARSAGQNVPKAPPAAGRDTSPDDRRRWLRSRYSRPSYRALRKSAGSHKQNRRRQLASR